jgi:tetratricopeptide (TPR) repeat protein
MFMANYGMEINSNRSQQLSTFVLVWLGPLDDSMKTLLRSGLSGIITSIEHFDRASLCISHLANVNDKKVILVLSTPQAQSVIAIVDDLLHIFFIYLFSTDSEIVVFKWPQEYSKVHGFYSDMNSLLTKISNDILILSDKSDKVSKSAILGVEKSAIAIYSNRANNIATTKLSENNSEFILFQVLIDVLLSLDLRNNGETGEALQICRHIYADNHSELMSIDEFEKNYTSDRAVYYYTRNCFLSRLLNKAFRLFDIDLLFRLRFFIVDIHAQLNKLYHEQTYHLLNTLTVYRGQMIHEKELTLLKNSIGTFVSMNSFLSTTTSAAVASIYSGEGLSRPEFQSVIFEIQIDCKTIGAKPFALISHLSHLSDEHEVLLSPGCVFRIESIEQSMESRKIVKLIYSDEVQQSVKDILHQFESDFGPTVNYITIGNVLSELGKIDQAKKYFSSLLEILPSSHTGIAEVYNNLGMLCYADGAYDLALKHYKMALNFVNYTDNALPISVHESENNIPNNPKTLILPGLDCNLDPRSRIYYNMGCMYQSMCDYQNALWNFQKACALTLETVNESLDVAGIYSRMGSVYYHQGSYEEAQYYFEKAFSITAKQLPSNHSLIAAALQNIGVVHERTSKNATLTSTEKQLQALSTEDTTHASAS